MHYLAALRTCGNAQRYRCRNRRNIHVSAECELRIGDENFSEEVLTVALKAFVLINFEDHEYVTARPATRTRISNSAQCHVLTGRDSRWNLDGHLLFRPHASFASAFLARRGDYLAVARTVWADRDAD